MDIYNTTLIIVLAPLLGCLIAGLLGKKIGPVASHRVTIFLVGVSFALSFYLNKLVLMDGLVYVGTVYTWATSGAFQFNVGFLIDPLSAMMIWVVTFVSFLVHIYSIGYLHDDPGYQRFFSYISLFTFAMLMLVTANNFMQLFFGWEGVGLVSYLLIGFWFKRDSANNGSLKAFIVNRVGDFGFILGIAAILDNFGTVDYLQVFQHAPTLAALNPMVEILPGFSVNVIGGICVLLFIGAMGKSAQVPLHVWLPESMEGPTPISALIHAATMVTAGIYMVSRMSPLFELSPTALSLVLIVGATGALFLGLVAVVQNDIKRVVAYSTLSQLGYMTAALGASAYPAAMFHLFTHASFKALLFLGAGSAIIAMHHEQDMRKMGNLRKYMPITYITFLIGALSLSAIPPFSGFFSKDAIIEAVKESTTPGAHYAYWCVLLGAFVTPLYIFRALFMTFHTHERMDEHTRHELKESPWVVWLPLVLLAIPSVIQGAMMAGPLLYTSPGILGHSIFIANQHDVMAELANHFHGIFAATIDAIYSPACWLAISGIFVAWVCYCYKPNIPRELSRRFSLIYFILVNKYGFDRFNEVFFIHGTKRLASVLYRVGDVKIIDGTLVNGTGRLVNWVSQSARHLQTGFLYHYAFAMILGLVVFLVWLLH